MCEDEANDCLLVTHTADTLEAVGEGSGAVPVRGAEIGGVRSPSWTAAADADDADDDNDEDGDEFEACDPELFLGETQCAEDGDDLDRCQRAVLTKRGVQQTRI